MSQDQVDLLDLKLAWQRVRDDQQEDHIFIRHPYEIVLVENEGFIEVWDKPGLGVEFKVEAAKKYLSQEDKDFFD